jgi:hypothetical protein
MQRQQPDPGMYNAGYNQPPVVTYAPPMVVVAAPSAPVRYVTYNSRVSVVCGIALIVAGVISNVAQAVIFAAARSGSFGVGTWLGIMCIIAGSFGIAAGRAKTKCTIVAFMVLSILTAIGCIMQLLVSSAIITAVGIYENELQSDRSYSTDIERRLVAVCALLLVSGVIGGITSIVGSAFGCKVVCCGSNVNQQVGLYAMQRDDVACLDPGQSTAYYQPTAGGSAQPPHQPPSYDGALRDQQYSYELRK